MSSQYPYATNVPTVSATVTMVITPPATGKVSFATGADATTAAPVCVSSMWSQFVSPVAMSPPVPPAELANVPKTTFLLPKYVCAVIALVNAIQFTYLTSTNP